MASKDLAKSIERGKGVYAKSCASCHGVAGLGDGPDGMYFTPPPTDLTAAAMSQRTDAQLYLQSLKGKGNMPAFEGKLDAAAIWDVVNYVKTLPAPAKK